MSTASSYQSSLGDDSKPVLKKFILLQDAQAKSKRGVNSSKVKVKFYSKHEDHKVLKGSLWELRESISPNQSISSFGSSGSRFSSSKHQSNSHYNQTKKIELDSIEYDDVWLVCPESHVSVLDEHQSRILLAIPDCEIRFKLFDDHDRFAAVSYINVNSEVMVHTRNHSNPLSCIVRWTGRITGKQGLWFGVEIQDPTQFGLGDSNGVINGTQCFSCEPNNGLLVNIASLTLLPPQRPERKPKKTHRSPGHSLTNGASHSGSTSSSEHASHNDISESFYQLYPATQVKVNDRVIWPYDGGFERATVKWVGELPFDENVEEGETLVGVEFDNPVGKGTGYYKKQRLFCAKKGHASLVPLDGLYKETPNDVQEFSTPSPPPEFGDGRCSGINANDILRSLDLEIDSDRENINSPGANHITESPRNPKHPNSNSSSPKIFSSSNSSCKSIRNSQRFSTVSVVNSNDSLDGNKNIGHQLPSNSARTAGSVLRVPVTDRRPSSIGSISPRSYDGSDTHSSPTHSSPQHTLTSHQEPRQTPLTVSSVKNMIKASTKLAEQQSATKNKQVCIPSVPSQHKPTVIPSHKQSTVRRVTPSTSQVSEGSPVYVDGKLGIIAWIGYELSKPNRYFAGVKMETANSSCSNGWYGDERLIETSFCDILFVNLEQCHLTCSNGIPDNNPSKHTAAIEGNVLPPENANFQFIGEWKGIQGDNNSCYMDSSIYAMFSFCTVFDGILHNPQKSTDLRNYKQIQETLRSRIVNPLRRNGLVRAHSMHQLRRLLDEVGLVKGLKTEEKDPEEFINLLLVNIFAMPAPVELSNNQSSHTFHLLVEKDARIAFPTIQELLEHTCAQEKIKFKRVPSYLIIHMPRFGREFRMYEKLFPNIRLDLTDVLEGAQRTCYMCGEVAVWECPECYKMEFQWNKSTHCTNCSMTIHKHEKRADHMPIELKIDDNMMSSSAKPILELNSALCIKTSHYVAFTRTGDGPDSTWLLFDSMADRQDVENIPRVTPIDNVSFWLSSEGYENIAKDLDTVPNNIRRLLQDGYIYFYNLVENRQYS